MKITFTERAISKLSKTIEDKEGYHVKLKYDTDGCGCVVSGVTALWIVQNVEEDDVCIQTNFVPVYVEKSKMIFMDEEMKIDFNEAYHTYMLTSPQQILNPRMSCVLKEV